MTFRTIQPIGKKPDTTPSNEARIDMLAGIVKTNMAIRLVRTSAMMAAICALTLPVAINTKSVTTGIAAAMVESELLVRYCSGACGGHYGRRFPGLPYRARAGDLHGLYLCRVCYHAFAMASTAARCGAPTIIQCRLVTVTIETNKVPAVTLGFWAIKICATTLGETGGDLVSMTLGLGYLASTGVFLAVFLVLAAAQVRARRYHPAL